MSREKPEESPDDAYVLLVTRSVVGNCALFWAEGRSGYTCDLEEAHVFTRKEAYSQHRCRPEVDLPVPLSMARSVSSTHVRIEHVYDALAEAPDEERQDPYGVSTRRERKKL